MVFTFYDLLRDNNLVALPLSLVTFTSLNRKIACQLPLLNCLPSFIDSLIYDYDYLHATSCFIIFTIYHYYFMDAPIP